MTDRATPEKGLRIWPPAEWCAAINTERTHICDRPRGHDGDHMGPELPTVTIDDAEVQQGAPR